MRARRDLADPCLPDAGQDEGSGVGVGDLADAAGDQGQGVVLLGPRQQQCRQLLGHRHPLLAVPRLPVQTRVLHGNGRGLGQGEHDRGVPVLEPSVLVAQI